MTKIENVGHSPDLSGICQHLSLTASGKPGILLCLQCGAGIRLKGMTDEGGFHVVAKEGDDVSFDWPGEG